MKQKITIYHIAEDARNGTHSHIFTTKQQVEQWMRDCIGSTLSGVDTEDADYKEIEAHLAAGRINEAWDIFGDRFKDPFDTYNPEESEIEVEIAIPELDQLQADKAELVKALSALADYEDDPNVSALCERFQHARQVFQQARELIAKHS